MLNKMGVNGVTQRSRWR